MTEAPRGLKMRETPWYSPIIFLTCVISLTEIHEVHTQYVIAEVIYPDKQLCAVRRSTVSLPCYYYSYPQPSRVTQKLWCSMNSNKGLCHDQPYVYNSLLNNDSNYRFIGNDRSDCTLLIRNVQFNHSGEYKFRFITYRDKYTGTPGVALQVTDVKTSLIRLSGNGTLKPGDALNLTCDVNCTHTSSQLTWTKDDQRLPESGSVLHFPALTAKDSGKYTCTWETGQTSGYDTISIHVEVESVYGVGSVCKDFKQEENWIIIFISVVVAVVVVGSLVIWAALIFYRRKRVAAYDIRPLPLAVMQDSLAKKSGSVLFRNGDISYNVME